MIRLPIFILLWVPMILIDSFPLLMLVPFASLLEWPWWMYFLPIGTVFIGLVAVAAMYPLRNDHYDSLPWWTRPFANPEDWKGGESSFESSLPKWWVVMRGAGFKSWYHYHAIRNPANGMRSFECLDLDIDSPKVRYHTPLYYDRYEPNQVRNLGKKTAWYIAWQGYQAGFKVVHIWSDTHHLVIKLGWRVEPRDTDMAGSSIGTEDASFASKVLLYRKG